jgi:SAM-dependent methyltransferase
MKLGRTSADDPTPSRGVLDLSRSFAIESPVLDAPCGTGRNGLYLAGLGFDVVGADRDFGRLIKTRGGYQGKGKLRLVGCDLNGQGVPFERTSFGALLIVHFIPRDWGLLFDLLRPGGLILIETMGGQGGNFLELPFAGELPNLVIPRFAMEHYRERPVGPPASGKVAAVLIARKRRPV